MIKTKQSIATAGEKPVAAKPLLKFIVPFVLTITAFVFFNSVNNGILGWDDTDYISSVSSIAAHSNEGGSSVVKHLFTTNVRGNYHPITMLSYYLEYKQYKNNPKPYHVTNLILHLLNVSLVLYFIWLLTKQQLVSSIVALLFAVHPMHVESVAWISERKDLLYSFFYLMALCSYLNYLKKVDSKYIYYILTLLLFVLAVLSKAVAVSLPVVFLAVDYFTERKLTVNSIVEKIPFLFISLFFGFKAIEAQKTINAFGLVEHYSVSDKFLFTCYGIMAYLYKLIVPINLSCLYEYPLKEGGYYPVVYYAAPVLVLGLVFLVYIVKSFRRDIIFGLSFFLITIALVLQILPVGGAIIADRYTYLPYIGVFFILARFVNNIWEDKANKYRSLKPIIGGLLVFFLVMCCYVSVQRCKVWHDSISLWTDAISKSDKSALAFNNRGSAYYLQGRYDQAIADYTSAIALKFDFPDLFYNRGIAYYVIGQYDKAIDDFNRSNDTKNDYPLGLAYFLTGRYNEAIQRFTLTITNNPKAEKVYYNRGLAYLNIGKYREAILDFTAEIQTNGAFADAYLRRAQAYSNTGQFMLALTDAFEAKRLGYSVDPVFLQTLESKK